MAEIFSKNGIFGRFLAKKQNFLNNEIQLRQFVTYKCPKLCLEDFYVTDCPNFNSNLRKCCFCCRKTDKMSFFEKISAILGHKIKKK